MYKKNKIFFFYTGGLKRDVNIINNLSIKFKKIYFFTIGADIHKLKAKKNLIITKPLILKIFLFIVSKLENILKFNSFLQYISFVFIDFFYSIYFLSLFPDKNDIVIAENNISSTILFICKIKKIKTILDVSNTHVVDKYNKISFSRSKKISFYERLIIKRGLKEYKLANKITVLSTNVYETFKKHDPSLLYKITKIHSGIDTNIFNIKNEKKVFSICIVGVISKFKNVHNIFKVINSIKSKKLNILIIGNYDYSLKKIEITNHKVTHFKSLDQKKLPFYYSRSKILCIGSYIEGMPKVVLEASACGIPTVGFEGSSISDIVIDNVNGYVLKNEDYKNLKKKILFLLNSNKYLSMGQNASKIISKNFSLLKYSERWNKNLIELMKSK